MSGYESIVIGGGHNGLTAAAYLAKRGRKVLVLEKRDQLGGLAASDEFFPGYRDGGLLWDTSHVRDEVISALNLEDHGLTREAASPPIFVPDSKRGFYLSDNANNTAEEIARFSSHDAEAYVAWTVFFKRICGVMANVIAELPNSVEALSFGELWGLARKGMAMRRLGKADMLEIMRIMVMCNADYLGEHFGTERLKAALAAPAHFATFTGPWSPGSTSLLVLQKCSAKPALVGGGPALISALKSAAEAYGVEMRCNSEVKQIHLVKGRVSAVTLAGGERIEADQILSSLDPKSTFLNLLPPAALNMNLEAAVNNYRMRGTTARINLALDHPLTFACRPDDSPAYARIVQDIDSLERAFDPVKYGRFSEKPTLEIHVPSVEDDSCSPPGCTSVSILAHFAPYDLRAGWSEEKKNALGDAVVRVLTRYAPEVKGHIVARRVQTPVDLEAAYGLSGGHLHHGEHALDQLVVRPTMDCNGYHTPIQGLWLCGSSSRPGGGLTCMPGYRAARATLEKPIPAPI